MENLKQTLIEFQKYLKLPGVDNMRNDKVRAENFISINERFDEAKAVRQNEQIQSFCPSCNGHGVFYNDMELKDPVKCDRCDGKNRRCDALRHFA